MARKIAAGSALFVFAVAILLGLRAQNTFSTTVCRALLAMAATFAVGLVIGVMAQKMTEEGSDRNLSRIEKEIGNSPAETGPNDR